MRLICDVDDQERLAFLTSLADRVNKPDSQDAYVYALADVAGVKLRLQDAEGARKDLDQSQAILDGFDSVETIVHAAFYKVNADYYHVGVQLLSGEAKQFLTYLSPNKSLRHITETPSSIYHASISTTSRKRSASGAPMISASQPWSRTQSTTLASFSCTQSWTRWSRRRTPGCATCFSRSTAVT